MSVNRKCGIENKNELRTIACFQCFVISRSGSTSNASLIESLGYLSKTNVLPRYAAEAKEGAFIPDRS